MSVKSRLLKWHGVWGFTCRNPDGSIAWSGAMRNGIPTAAITDMLRVYFDSGAQKTQWYAGLISDTNYEEVTADDTLSSHAGWEEYTSYEEATRQEVTTFQASGGTLTMSSPVAFTFTANATIRGVFLASGSAKGGTTGVLFSTAPYAQARSILAGQTLTWTYLLRGSGGGA